MEVYILQNLGVGLAEKDDTGVVISVLIFIQEDFKKMCEYRGTSLLSINEKVLFSILERRLRKNKTN